jgi:hypothetical protein
MNPDVARLLDPETYPLMLLDKLERFPTMSDAELVAAVGELELDRHGRNEDDDYMLWVVLNKAILAGQIEAMRRSFVVDSF